AMFDDRGRTAKSAPPSTPVEVLGLQGVPEAGDHFQVTDEAKARHIVEYRQSKQRDAAMARTGGGRVTLDQLHEQLKAGEVKELPIVIKADVQGSVEVLSEMLPKLSTEQVKLKIIGSGVGAVTENDVLLASASGAIIIAFGVGAVTENDVLLASASGAIIIAFGVRHVGGLAIRAHAKGDDNCS